MTMEVTTLNGVTEAGAGHRDGPLGQALFSCPTQCVCDAEGNVYVADQMNHCIRKAGLGTYCSPCQRRMLHAV